MVVSFLNIQNKKINKRNFFLFDSSLSKEPFLFFWSLISIQSRISINSIKTQSDLSVLNLTEYYKILLSQCSKFFLRICNKQFLWSIQQYKRLLYIWSMYGFTRKSIKFYQPAQGIKRSSTHLFRLPHSSTFLHTQPSSVLTQASPGERQSRE